MSGFLQLDYATAGDLVLESTDRLLLISDLEPDILTLTLSLGGAAATLSQEHPALALRRVRPRHEVVVLRVVDAPAP